MSLTPEQEQVVSNASQEQLHDMLCKIYEAMGDDDRRMMTRELNRVMLLRETDDSQIPEVLS